MAWTPRNTCAQAHGNLFPEKLSTEGVSLCPRQTSLLVTHWLVIYGARGLTLPNTGLPHPQLLGMPAWKSILVYLGPWATLASLCYGVTRVGTWGHASAALNFWRGYRQRSATQVRHAYVTKPQ